MNIHSLTSMGNIDRIIRLPECINITGRSAVSIYRDQQKGAFPLRVKLGANSVGWKLSSILKWLDDREEVTDENCCQVAPGSKRGRKPRNSSEVAI